MFLFCPFFFSKQVSFLHIFLLCACSYFAHVPTLHMFYSVYSNLTLLMHNLVHTLHQNVSMDKDCNRAKAKFINKTVHVLD